MVDFKKLLNQTREEREAARKESDEAFNKQLRDTIDRRATQVAEARALLERSPAFFSDWEKGFLDSMQSLLRRRDASGVDGAAIADLSTAQVWALDELSEATRPGADQAEPLPPPAHERDQP